MGRSKSLTSVDLSSQEWKNGEASGLLPQLLDCKSLATLNLSCAECGPHIGAGLAQRLKGHPALTSLQLDSCELGSGALPICAAVGDCGLTELNLSSNELDAAAANALGEALASSVTLKRIDIQSNLIEEGGVALGKGLAASTSLVSAQNQPNFRPNRQNAGNFAENPVYTWKLPCDRLPGYFVDFLNFASDFAPDQLSDSESE